MQRGRKRCANRTVQPQVFRLQPYGCLSRVTGQSASPQYSTAGRPVNLILLFSDSSGARGTQFAKKGSESERMMIGALAISKTGRVMPRGTAKKQSAQQNKNAKSQNAKSTSSPNAVALLKADHRKVEELFEQYKKASSPDQKQKIAHEVCKELIIHTKLEEEIFYPACRDTGVEDEMLNAAQVEHDGAKTLIAELIETSPEDEFYDAKVKVLSAYIEHHVGEEERPRTGIFAKAQSAEVDMSGLGQQLQNRKQQLMAEMDEESLEPPEPRSLHPSTYQSQEDYRMPRQSDYRDRDEYGRFMSEDDEYRGRGGRGGYRERDEEGRFMSEGSRGRRGAAGNIVRAAAIRPAVAITTKTKSIAARAAGAVMAAGLVIRKVIRKHRSAAGSTARAAVIQPVAAIMTRTTAIAAVMNMAAGTAILKVTPKRRNAAGNTAGAVAIRLVVATMKTTSIARAALAAVVDMVAGLATPKATRKLHAAVGTNARSPQ